MEKFIELFWLGVKYIKYYFTIEKESDLELFRQWKTNIPYTKLDLLVEEFKKIQNFKNIKTEFNEIVELHFTYKFIEFVIMISIVDYQLLIKIYIKKAGEKLNNSSQILSEIKDTTITIMENIYYSKLSYSCEA